jgi:hypothetical protein
MTHSMIRSVAPTGHVYTFEFHENRCELARAEFERHVRILLALDGSSFIPIAFLIDDAQGLSKYVTCFYGDAYANCFERLPEKVDAMFLDLPKPWYFTAKKLPPNRTASRSPEPFISCRLCCSFAKEALKDGGKLVTFSPCIEQIQVANCSCPLLYGQSQCPPLMLTRVSLAENRSTNAFCWFPRRAHVRNSLAQHGLRALRSHRCRFGRRIQRLDAQAYAPDQTAEGSSAVFDSSGFSFNCV